MVLPSRRALELNELNWWSNWARLSWLGKSAYFLSSQEFPEVFFNKGGMLGCRQNASSLARLESRFTNANLDPAIMVYETCSDSVERLIRSGYRASDKMSVLAGTGTSSVNHSEEVNIKASDLPGNWSRAYLLSFYGETRLLPPVLGIVRRLLKLQSVTLLEASIGGKVAGVLALSRTPMLAGVYCVGTVPRFRRKGVAGALLSEARAIAASEGRALVLQTLKSDAAERFYAKRGFRRLYRKNLMEKKS